MRRLAETVWDGQRWTVLDAKRQRQYQNGDDAKTSGQTDHKEKEGEEGKGVSERCKDGDGS